MLHQGQAVGLEVFWPVEIYGQWHTLSATASAWAAESSAAAEQMESASSSWTGLVSSYREAETQEIVRTALDEAPEVTREWAGVVGRAADVLQSFATEANGLQQQAAALEGQATRLQARLWASNLLSGGGDDEDTSAEDAALRGEIEVHNSDVMALNSKWRQLEQQTASEIDSIASGGGYQDEIPVINTDGATFGPPAGGLGPGGFGAGGSLAGGALAGLALAGGSLNGGAGLGIGFQSALGQMIRSGNYDPVDTATKLYETVTSDEVTGEDMQSFYDHLGTMTPEEIEEFSSGNQHIHYASPATPENQRDLDHWPDGAEWWNGMNEAQKNAMVEHLPLLTGNTEGVPYAERDTANEAALGYLLASTLVPARHKERLREIGESSGGDARMILSLRTGAPWDSDYVGDPLAAVSVGNPDTAETTSFNIPGMGSGTHNMTDEVDRAELLSGQAEGDHAVISWVGYDAPASPDTTSYFPDWGEVLSDNKADEGGWALAHSINGFNNTMEGQDREAILRINAHSYATNAAAHALTRVDQPVDSFTMYGSAGIPVSVAWSAEDLEVKETSEGRPAVYATEADEDTTARWGYWLGGGRVNPTDDEFGAYVFSSDGEGNVPGAPVTDHRQNFWEGGEPEDYGYLDEGSQSLNSILMIMDGQADAMTFLKSD